MKILIAEDQAISREMLVMMLTDFGEVEAFSSGQEALDAFKNSLEKSEPFTVMILDISMPVMSGIEVLRAVRALENKNKISKQESVKVLMFTSYADKDTVISCYQAGCDDYALKPFNRRVVIEKMQKFGFLPKQQIEDNKNLDLEMPAEKSMGKIVSDAIDEFKKGKIELPALPHIIQELQNIINNPNASASDMAKIIENDAAISIKLIIAANSPFYGSIEKTKDVKMAINRLGLDVTQSIVSAIANKGLYKTKNSAIKDLMDKIWEHSIATAYCAREISKKVASSGHEKVYVKGLIHDVGATLLIKNIGESVTENGEIDINGLVNAVSEVHASFGGYLLNKWNFSKDFVDVAILHEWNKFSVKTDKEVLIVNLADALTYKIGYGFFNKEMVEISEIQSVALLELTDADLELICEKAEQSISETLSVFAKI